jgi:MFS family permease
VCSKSGNHSECSIYYQLTTEKAGAFVGIMMVSYVMDKWGRKAGVIFCSFWSLLGGALLCGSKSSAMFIVARFFAGMGSWGYLAVSK